MVIKAKVIASSLGAAVSITFHKARGSNDCVLSRRRPGRWDTFSEVQKFVGLFNIWLQSVVSLGRDESDPYI